MWIVAVHDFADVRPEEIAWNSAQNLADPACINIFPSLAGLIGWPAGSGRYWGMRFPGVLVCADIATGASAFSKCQCLRMHPEQGSGQQQRAISSELSGSALREIFRQEESCTAPTTTVSADLVGQWLGWGLIREFLVDIT